MFTITFFSSSKQNSNKKYASMQGKKTENNVNYITKSEPDMAPDIARTNGAI